MYEQPKFYKLIDDLIDKRFPLVQEGLDSPTKRLLKEQLSWLLGSEAITSLDDPLCDDGMQKEIREVERTLACIENGLLLRKAGLRETEEDQRTSLYERFILGQSSDEALSPDSFKKLASYFSTMSEDNFSALILGRLITAVSLSPRAKEFAQTSLGDFSKHSVMFSIETIAKCPEIYPAYQQAGERVQPIIQSCLMIDPRLADSGDTTDWLDLHLRHGFFFENYDSWMRAIQRGVETKSISEEGLGNWLDHWKFNLLGYYGHTNKGSFFTESNFKRLENLNRIILDMTKGSKGSSYSIQDEYQKACYEYLNSGTEDSTEDDVDPQFQTYLVRLASMSGNFNSAFFSGLKEFLMGNMDQYKEYIQLHDEIYREKRVTYLPATLESVTDLNRKREEPAESLFSDLIEMTRFVCQMAFSLEAGEVLSLRSLDAALIDAVKEKNYDIRCFKRDPETHELVSEKTLTLTNRI